MLSFYLSLIDDDKEQQRFTVVYEKHRQLLYHTALSIVHDEQLAEDCVHNAFIDIAKNFSKVGAPDEPRTVAYLLTIVRTCSIRVFHAQHKTDTLPPEDFECYPDESEPDADEGALQAAIQALPDIYREPLLLRYVYDYSSAHVAQLCGISDATVRKRIERAKKMLRDALSMNNL